MPQYYPALNNLIETNKIPEPLKTPITNIIDKLFYKGYYVERSNFGDIGYYNITIVIGNEIGLNLFGGEEGFELLFNPGSVADTTEIPLALYYNLPILKYVNNINVSQLSTPKDYFNLIVKMLSISEERILLESIYELFNGSIEEFITHFNTNPNYSTYPPILDNYGGNDDEIVTAITDQLRAQDVNIYLYLMEEVIAVENDIPASFDNLYSLFKSFLGSFTFEKILKLFIPKFSVTIQQLELALAFPRTWLKPIDANGDVNPDENVKSMLTYNVGSISYHSEKGFEFINPNSFRLTPSQIGNTGILIDIRNLKFDFRTDKNIPEATADGKPDSFKGVYVEYAALTLPKKWFNDEDNHDQTTARIAGYNLLIGSGGLSGTIALETVSYINSDGNITDFYSSHFSFNYPIQAIANNTITDIVDYSALLAYLNTPENKNYQYIYPLSITKADNSELTFNNTAAFHSYLNTLGTESSKLIKKLGGNGFEISFTSFDMTFKQGNIVESNIVGGMKIPRLKDSQNEVAEIEIKGHLDEDGGFNITASEQDGFAPLKMPGILELYIQSLEVGRDSSDEPFYIGTSCEIKFTNQIMDKFLNGQRIKIDHMRIYSDGSFEIGAISVPTTFTINLGPVEITITGINFGSYQEEHDGVMRKYNYFGFDGAISLDPIGVDARGEGIKYYYTTDDGAGKPHHSFIRIKTIGVDLTIPGNASASNATAIIKGWLSINENEYAGGISLKLPKLNIAGGADMRLQPKPPAFIIDAYLDLPIAIPLAATGLGITGFRGLAGFRYVAEKEAVGLHSHDDSWYDYYTYPPRGVHVTKFNGPDKTERYTNPVSLGAGVTITTMGSSDVISLRVMVLLSIPNMLLIDGRASILSKQWGLDDSGEPPFFAFLIIADNGIEIGAGLDFKLPQDSGNIIDLHVAMQAGYFWDNPSGWYLNMGTKDDPITAKVLKLVEMESYLMLSASGIEAGAKVVFDIDERFGPIRVKAWLKIEVGGFISFERPQVGGHLEVDAGARVDLFGIITVSVNFYTFFSAEAAKPFLIYGEVRVCGKIKVLFVKIKVCANVKFKWEKNRTIDTTPIAPLPVTTGTTTQTDMVKGIHMLTGETFNVVGFGTTAPSITAAAFDNAIIPLDTYIDIKFDKGLLPSTAVRSKIGGYNNPPEGHEDLIPPVHVSRSGRELRQVKHQYKITNIELFASDGNAWQPYDPYKAVVSTDDVNNGLVSNLKMGHWQKSNKEYNAIRILGNSPFSYTQQGEPGWFIPEQIGITAASLFCEAQPKEPKCVNWNQKPVGTTLWTPNRPTIYDDLYFNAVISNSNIVGNTFNLRMTVVDTPNIFNIPHALSFPNSSELKIKLPKPSVKVELKLSSNAQQVKVSFYKSHLPAGSFLIEYVETETVIYPLDDLDGLIYESVVPITKIKIAPVATNQQQIDAINEQIEQLFIETYAYYTTHPTEIPLQGITEPIDITQYRSLTTQLTELLTVGCTAIQNQNNQQARSLGCNRHPIYCALYDDLYQVSLNCANTFDCKNQVYAIFKLFENQHPREFKHIYDILNTSGAWVAFENATNITELNTALNTYLNLIDQEGNCTCQDNTTYVCNTQVHQICYTTKQDSDYNINIPSQQEIQEDYEATVNAINKVVEPIWRPNTKYYIHFTLEDEVNGVSNPFEYYYGFKTAGPIGHYHNAPNVVYGNQYNPENPTELLNRDTDGKLTNPDEFALTSLNNYIDYKRSYPNANGDLLNAKPLFYGGNESEILLFFIKPYVYHMFKNIWDANNGLSIIDNQIQALKIFIKDPVLDVIIPHPMTTEVETIVPSATETWKEDNSSQMPEYLQFLHNLADSNDNCIFTGGEPIKPANHFTEVKLGNLKPTKLYTAIITNTFGTKTIQSAEDPNTSVVVPNTLEVHKFVFETSKYANFEEQVMSFQLKDSNDVHKHDAIFNIEIPLTTTAISNALTIVKSNGETNPEFLDPFDAVMEGVLGINPLDPPVTTEFNFIKNSNTGDTIALWIRNPEPFNDPKIPLEIIKGEVPTNTATFGTVNILNAAANNDTNYKMLFSKDYSQVLFMLEINDSFNPITDNTLKLKFKYLKWNGNIYEVATDLDVIEINQINA